VTEPAARCEVQVSTAAITANARRLRDAAAGAELYAVVKADGYGHGAVDAARAALAGGATRVCVATLAEAESLRSALGSEARIVVLTPLTPGEERRVGGLEIVVSEPSGLGRLAAAGVSCRVHVEVETGMGRWGLAPDDALDAGRALAAGEHPGLELAGLMSHLATADQPDTTFRDLQVERFAAFAASFPPCPRHLASSAATLRPPGPRFDAVRCGIALYGVSPFEGDPALDGLEPALTWTSRVAALRDLAPGDSAGYGRRLVADRPLRIALVPVGYGDGYPRILSGASDVLIGGRRRRVAATVSMDQLSAVVDEDVRVGDEVVLLGRQGDERVGAEELARLARTIGYEICCGVRGGGERASRRTSSLSG
jgi:alanine racemase